MASPTPPRNSRAYSGLINHWFPSIRPCSEGGTFVGGSLTSHDVSGIVEIVLVLAFFDGDVLMMSFLVEAEAV